MNHLNNYFVIIVPFSNVPKNKIPSNLNLELAKLFSQITGKPLAATVIHILPGKI